MQKLTPLSLVLALVLVGCSTPTVSQTRVFFSGTPSIQDVVSDQARILVTVSYEDGYRLQAPAPFDYAAFTLKNDSFLNTPLTKGTALSPGQNATLMFTALRPGAGYTLDLTAKTGGASGTQAGMSHADSITLTAGQTATVNMVIGLDHQISVTYDDAQAPDHKWAAPEHMIVTGGTVTLNTGFGSLSDPDIATAGISHMRVTLSSELHTDGAVIDNLLKGGTNNFQTFSWNTASAAGSYNPTSLPTRDAGATGKITFELLTSTGAIVGRSEMNVTLFKGSSIEINLIEEADD